MNVGARIFEIRRQKHLTIKDVSAMSGVSTSLISQVENNKANPSLFTLKSLAAALGVDMVEFFTSQADIRHSDSVVMRSMEEEISDPEFTEDYPGIHTFKLANGGYGKFYFSYKICEEGFCAPTEIEPNKFLDGHEFGYIIKGKLMVEFEDQTVVLNAGDSICYESSRPHRLRNFQNGTTEFLWMIIEN